MVSDIPSRQPSRQEEDSSLETLPSVEPANNLGEAPATRSRRSRTVAAATPSAPSRAPHERRTRREWYEQSQSQEERILELERRLAASQPPRPDSDNPESSHRRTGRPPSSPSSVRARRGRTARPQQRPSRSPPSGDEPISQETLLRLLQQSLQANTRASTLAPQERRTPKLPDPKELNKRNEEPLFDQWRAQIEGKFQSNSDHFPTEQDRVNYVYNRTLGDALRYLTPRIRANATDRWATATEMIDYLAIWFTDPNKQLNSQLAFQKLQMGRSDSFEAFHAKFMELASEAETPQASYFSSLLGKVSAQLRNDIKAVLPDLGLDHQRLAARLLLVDQQNRSIRTAKEIAPGPLTGVSEMRKSQAGTAPFRPQRTPEPTRQTTPRPKTPEDSHLKSLALAGKCFNCERPRHISWDCPEPRKSGLINEFEFVRAGGLDDSDSEPDQEDRGDLEPQATQPKNSLG